LGSRKILIMDDEEMIRNVAGKMLEFLGYAVATASEGEEALRLYRDEIAAGGSFLAVLLDWHVEKGMDGLETLRRLRQLDPAIKAILSSGYPDQDQQASRLAAGFAAVINKPYELKTLQAVFNRLAGEAAAGEASGRE
jgi:two-component system, cell cycle sensor histidine kinase and response regulator CckA